MALWMDLTFSLDTYEGSHAVGIAWVELEWAKALHRIDPSVRFFVVRKKGFYEIPHQELIWLFEGDNVCDDYFRKNNKKQQEHMDDAALPIGLQRAMNWQGKPTGRAGRFNILANMLVAKTPRYARWMTKVMLRPPAKALLYLANRKGRFFSYRLDNHSIENVAVEDNPFGANDIIFSCGWYDNKVDKEARYAKLKENCPDIRLIYFVYDLVLTNPSTAALYREKFFLTDI